MTTKTLIITALLAMLPISELRGAIPYAVANGMTLPMAALLAFIMNALVAPAAFLFLETFHKLFYHWGWYKRLFDRVVERTRTKLHAKIEKYGYWGLLLFVAVPLPVTGAWTGTLAAWIFGLGRRKSMLMIALGVFIACIIVSLVVGLGVSALSIFVKEV